MATISTPEQQQQPMQVEQAPPPLVVPLQPQVVTQTQPMHQGSDFFTKKLGKDVTDLSQPWSTTAEGQRAEGKLKSNPYDIDAWGILIREAQGQHSSRARILFEKLVIQFPTCGRFWKTYIEHEMGHRNYDKVEKLFQRCLKRVLHIDLWKCYVNYVRDVKRELSNYREKLTKAYEFALDNVGLDMNSTSIWKDFIHFLKTSDCTGTFAETQKTNQLRKTYQRAIATALQGVENIWKSYSDFETGCNQSLAKKFIEDKTRVQMAARRTAKAFETDYRSLNKNGPPTPPTGNPKELQQIDLWKSYINWEKSNVLQTDDMVTLTKRVMFAYEQCLLVFPYHTHIWYEAAQYLESRSKFMAERGEPIHSNQMAEEVANWYERSISHFLPDSLLLYFAYSDYEEGRMKYEKVHKIYEKGLENEELDPTLIYIQYMKFARRVEGIQGARVVFHRARKDTKSKHHVYIAAALMEYYSSKLTITALKIFDLGLKKFGAESTYVLAYLDFLTHLNDENNARVLFEKALSQVPPEQTGEIWDKFYEFENNIGDLTSLLKVEKRRFESLEELLPERMKEKEATAVVDRYKYLDLYPCAENELKVMKYRSRSGQLEVGVKGLSVSGSVSESSYESHIYKPDVRHMRPYRPSAAPGVGLLTHAGGVTPIPESLTDLLSKLPPPTCFHGPFVKVDELMRKIAQTDFPHDPDIFLNSIDTLKFEEKPKTTKRIHPDHEIDGESPPVHDLYRERRQNKKQNLSQSS
ncbi:Cleavage stimulation factor subunit 3 [Oopsacas minuta]|uniref:Cleavage stimulation factor subunit 3 n=1 Tax=Oopsacas minuta TaxID=111878 RepID=A0AAV7JLN8_9METZ|nr:Cleavage stimulation factor subunit 3 [Oopsacas minuta]